MFATDTFATDLPTTNLLATELRISLAHSLRLRLHHHIVDHACRDGTDIDAIRPGHDSGNDPLGFDIEHTDRVAESAGLLRLAAQRQRDAGGLINDGHGIAALHDFRLH